ncbi:flagellar brake protein [Aliivibrio salmonicida]|uniref:Type IV pilus assembly (PilZ) protein n=1 Tax=Aliivibrio salmonicida (strain LFI1238) TaxID=316275 RepID=B6EJC4_ALISL|nr:flagellar brake protein [Aliivibrio salmonicida]AZL85443.1 flagellar brake protein [Aliivibrio salmonicida]CAQ79978.1 putative type IV pilus assembly (PilZ) protein [Aliivibrio salmonicida LFI1238]
MTGVSLSTNQNVLNKMDIGGRVIIEVSCPNGQSAQATSTLIGFKKGQYIFIEYPSSTSLEFNKIYLEGAEVTFRAMTNTTLRDVIAFRTQIHSVIYRPMEMLCLHAPKSISMRQIRTHQRIETEFECELTVGNHVLSGKISDFSAGGCAVLFPSKLNPDNLLNQPVSVSIQLDTLEPILIKGKIKNIDAKEKKSKVGVMFNADSITDSDLQTLHHQCVLKGWEL